VFAGFVIIVVATSLFESLKETLQF